MAYFANGTDGMVYEDKWCCRCVHGHDAEESMCPVWFAHQLWNYDNRADGEIATVLDAMIPTREDGFPDKYNMFVSTDDVPGQTMLFERTEKEQ